MFKFVKDKKAPNCRFLSKISIGSIFLKEKKGQGALEYILIIGAAVLIAAIVIAVLISSGRSAKKDVNDSMKTAADQLRNLNDVIAE